MRKTEGDWRYIKNRDKILEKVKSLHKYNSQFPNYVKLIKARKSVWQTKQSIKVCQARIKMLRGRLQWRREQEERYWLLWKTDQKELKRKQNADLPSKPIFFRKGTNSGGILQGSGDSPSISN